MRGRKKCKGMNENGAAGEREGKGREGKNYRGRGVHKVLKH